MTWKKFLYAFVLSVIVGFYLAFVGQTLWNWFAVPAFHVEEIGYWMAYGLFLLIHLLFDQDNSMEQGEIFGRLEMMLNACVRDDRREELNDELRTEREGLALRLFSGVFGKALGATITLGIGFVVHILAS